MACAYVILHLKRSDIENLDDQGMIIDANSAVRKAYYSLAAKHHPDRNASGTSSAEFVKFSNAFQMINDFNARQNYKNQPRNWSSGKFSSTALVPLETSLVAATRLYDDIPASSAEVIQDLIEMSEVFGGTVPVKTYLEKINPNFRKRLELEGGLKGFAKEHSDKFEYKDTKHGPVLYYISRKEQRYCDPVVETRSEKSSTSTDQKLKADGESAGAKLRPTQNNNNNNNNKNVAIPNDSCPFYWKNGWCRYKARCRFTHPNNPALKHKRCRMFFKKGNCPLGNTCPFSHVDGDFGSHDGSENNNLKSSNDMEGNANGMKFDWANVKGHKKVIVLGGSGHGKSTFINSLHNYFKNLPIERMEVVIRTHFLNAVNSAPKDTEMDFHDSTSSKTQYCTEYRFPSPDNRSSITFVDTPGLADTRGVSQDEKNMEFILTKAKEIEQSGDLLGIILIMKGTDARKNLSIRTITTFLMGNLPDLVLQNLIVIFTACSSKGKCTALSLTPWVIKEDLTFFIDNGAFASNFCALSAREKRIARNDWTDTMEELDCLLDLLSTMKVIPSDDQFTQLFKQRMSVKSSFNIVKQKIIEMQNVLQKLEVLQTQRHLAEDRKEKNKNFMTKEKIPIIELIDDPNAPLSTICSTCMQFCHNPCSLAEITSKGSIEFKGCAAFHGAANCRICLPDGATIGCSFETHFHGRKRLEKREDTIEKVLENIKQEYDAANQDLHVVDKSLNELDNAKRLVNLAIDGLVRDLNQQVNCLKTICSGINLVNELQIVLQQLTAESRLITNVQARDKADAVITAITAMMNSASSITRPPPPPSDTYCRPVTMTNRNHPRPPTSPAKPSKGFFGSFF